MHSYIQRATEKTTALMLTQRNHASLFEYGVIKADSQGLSGFLSSKKIDAWAFAAYMG